MEPLDIMWQEDLMPLLNPDALRQLQDATSTPVCISERLLTRWQMREFIENGSAQIVIARWSASALRWTTPSGGSTRSVFT